MLPYITTINTIRTLSFHCLCLKNMHPYINTYYITIISTFVSMSCFFLNYCWWSQQISLFLSYNWGRRLFGGVVYSGASFIRGRRLFGGVVYSGASFIRGRRLFGGAVYSGASFIRGRRLFGGVVYSGA